MFVKNDNSFTCVHCGKDVERLKYTSRDHCNCCLYSIHVDIGPGDRSNDCKGMLKPIYLLQNKKGHVIVYRCEKCGQEIRNIVASDDDRETIYHLMEEYAKNGGMK